MCVWGGGAFFYLSHTRWFDDVRVTLFASLVDDGGNEKLLKRCKSMRQQMERYAEVVSLKRLYVNLCACSRRV